MAASIVFIDPRVWNWRSLVADLPVDTVWHLLDEHSDGVAQMQAFLAGYRDLASVQIISHGSAGAFYIGSSAVNAASLSSYSNQWAAIGSALSETGDLLLYGCDVAAGERGEELIRQLAALTGADVAASIDKTGAAALGGNWTLEAKTGAIDATLLNGVSFQATLATASLSIVATSASKAEGQGGNTPFTFTVTRAGDTTGASSANWAVTGSGSRPANAADFSGGVLPSGTVDFLAGETSKVITINVAGDTTFENNETFAVVLSSPIGASLGTSSATGTILNDDASLSIVATSASKAEGQSGDTAFTFTVTRTGDTTGASSAAWTVTGSGSRPANAADFSGGVLPSGTVDFLAGETSKVITINVAGDTTFENNETFAVALSSPIGASLGTSSATGTILNDDASLSIVATSASKAEGQSGNTAFTFTVTRTGDTTGASSAAWAVTGSGSRPANAADFSGGVLPSGTVDFLAGETSKVITINVAGDTTFENNETFAVALSSPIGASLGTSSATGTILNDDASLSIVATSASKAEGQGGDTAFTFTVTRTGDTTGSSSAAWAVTGSGSQPADASDFSGGVLPSGTVNFAAGEITKTITVNVAGDSLVEGSEAFLVTLSNASLGTSIGTASASGIILNDDASLSIKATSASKAEGQSGGTPFTFTVTRSGDTTGTSSADWAVTGTGANAANALDFSGLSLPSGTVNFLAGEISKIITVNVAGDSAVEANESFTLTLSNPLRATLGTASAAGTILNDDTELSITPTSADKAENSSSFTFTVTRTGITSGVSSAAWTVIGSGTDPAGASDFIGNVLPSGTVTFLAGEKSKIITVAVLADTLLESDEGFTVSLSSPTGASFGTASAAGIIRYDEGYNVIVGTSGADNLASTAAADRIIALGGDDTIRGFAGADMVDGGAGSDTLILTATSRALNAASDTQLVNVEMVQATTARAGVTINLSWQTEDLNIIGSAMSDTLIGSKGGGRILGGLGNDEIYAGDNSGSGVVRNGLYGEGDDLFPADVVAGDDLIRGGNNLGAGQVENQLSGDGNWLGGRGGSDELYGGSNSGSGSVINNLFGDALRMVSGGVGGRDYIYAGSNSSSGTVNNEAFGDGEVMLGTSVGGNDEIRGGDNGGSGAVRNDLYGDGKDLQSSSVVAGDDLLYGGNNLASGVVNNHLMGDADALGGRGGNDEIHGGSNYGDGALYHSLEGDAITMLGGAVGGNDRIVAGSNSSTGNVENQAVGDAWNMMGDSVGGNDEIRGGDNGGSGAVRNDLYGDGKDLQSSSVVAGDDLLYGGNNLASGVVNNHLTGDADALGGRGGNDEIHGGSNRGSGVVYNVLYGDAWSEMASSAVGGADLIYGGDNFADGTVENFIYGDAPTMGAGAVGGNDTIFSGLNARDLIWGDAEVMGSGARGGADSFVFSGFFGQDKIMDFRPQEGDRIYFQDIFSSAQEAFDRAQDVGNDVVIESGSGDSLILVDVHRSDLRLEDFVII